MTDFVPVLLADAAAVEPDGDGRYVAQLVRDYTVLGVPNGGYLQCVMANAAVAAASDAGAAHLHATAVSTNFMAAPALGPAVLACDVRRVGRSASFVHVSLTQDDVVLSESLVTVGTLRDSAPLRYQSSTPPPLAPVESCIALPVREEMDYHHAVELRCDPDTPRWWEGGVSPAAIELWMRMTDGGGPWNPWSVIFALDVMPPATLALGSTGWVPTLQLSTYVRRIPASEWLRARQWCVVVADGLVDERCELFDDTGELVASASQLAMVRFGQS